MRKYTNPPDTKHDLCQNMLSEASFPVTLMLITSECIPQYNTKRLFLTSSMTEKHC